jgi:hypothetical protein
LELALYQEVENLILIGEFAVHEPDFDCFVEQDKRVAKKFPMEELQVLEQELIPL